MPQVFFNKLDKVEYVFDAKDTMIFIWTNLLVLIIDICCVESCLNMNLPMLGGYLENLNITNCEIQVGYPFLA
jgi:hypothetical protein